MTIRWTYAFADRPAARLADVCAFWTAATGTRLSAFRGEHGESATLLHQAADPGVRLQGVTEGDGGAHIDLCADDVRELTARARRLGAALVADDGAGPYRALRRTVVLHRALAR
ncbi:VOC family protein [Streptomyces flaveolus]